MAITKADLQSQLQAVLAQLEHYKATNNYLQCEIDKQELVKILQEQRNRTLEIQNQILEKNNEGLKKMLSDKDEQISQLKSHNQNLDEIKKSKNDKKLSYKSENNFKEDIMCLNKFIKDKDSELAQTHKKLEDQDSKICQHPQQHEKLQQKYDDIKKKHKLEIKKINDNLASNTEELFQLRIHNKTLLTKNQEAKT